MGMATPKMDGSVEPKSLLRERPEMQHHSEWISDFIFVCKQTGIEERPHDVKCRNGDYTTKRVFGAQMTFNVTVSKRYVDFPADTLFITCHWSC